MNVMENLFRKLRCIFNQALLEKENAFKNTKLLSCANMKKSHKYFQKD